VVQAPSAECRFSAGADHLRLPHPRQRSCTRKAAASCRRSLSTRCGHGDGWPDRPGAQRAALRGLGAQLRQTLSRRRIRRRRRRGQSRQARHISGPPGSYHIGRRADYGQPGAAKGSGCPVGEYTPSTERVSIGWLRYLHGSQVSVMWPRRFRCSVADVPCGRFAVSSWWASSATQAGRWCNLRQLTADCR
jgi:hypothetical protein